MNSNIQISFDNASQAEANRLALELSLFLESTTELKVEILKEHSNTQDIGTVLTVLITSGAGLALIRGLSAWLLKFQSRKITIKKDGSIMGENLSSKDIAKILDHLK